MQQPAQNPTPDTIAENVIDSIIEALALQAVQQDQSAEVRHDANAVK